MAGRGRPASSTPEDSVEAMAHTAGVEIPADEKSQQNRLSGLGPLLGTLTGVGMGAVVGILRYAGLRLPAPLAALAAGAGVIAVTDGSMTALGLTDPRKWDAGSWLSDALPHPAYGTVTVATLHAIDRD